MKKSKILKGFMFALVMTLMLVGGNISKAYAGQTCCDNMRLRTTLINTYYTYTNHTYPCPTHGVYEFCTITTKHNVYNKSCSNCGADWGNYEVTSESHSKCQ